MKLEEKRKLENLCRELITELKILAIRAEYAGQKENAEKYKTSCEKIKMIQEKSNLTLMSEDSETKRIYEDMLKIIENNYRVKTLENLENTMNSINELWENNQMQDNVHECNKKSEMELER